MIDTSAFETLAEFAIAQAGFASVVIVLGRHGSELHPADRFRIFNALVPSIVAGFLALAPVGLAIIGMSEDTVWQTALIVYAIAASGIAFAINRNMRRLSEEAIAVISNRYAAGNFLVTITLIAASLVNATTGLLGPPNAGLYFFGIATLLAVGASAFIRVVFIRPFD